MSNQSDLPTTSRSPFVLATDLDGTLIPLPDRADHAADLKTLSRLLQEQDAILCFVTGRHYESVLDMMQLHQLPLPDWMICDVGTTLRQRRVTGDAAAQPPVATDYAIVAEYHTHLSDRIRSFPIPELLQLLVDISQLRLQEQEKQGDFKLSYYVEQSQLGTVAQEITSRLKAENAPYSLIASIDPFNGDGLLDLLPKDVSKAYALRWWSQHIDHPEDSIVFAGDSGNDLAALTAGYSAIMVGNARPKLVEQVMAVHTQQGWKDRLYYATGEATSGVLEGCRRFGLRSADSNLSPP